MKSKRSQYKPYPSWAVDWRITTGTNTHFLVERLLTDKGKGGGAVETHSMTKIPSCMLANGSVTSTIAGGETGCLWFKGLMLGQVSHPVVRKAEVDICNWALGKFLISGDFWLAHLVLARWPWLAFSLFFVQSLLEVFSCRFESKAKSRVLEPLSKWVIRFRLCAYPDQSLAHTVCP